MVTVLDMPRYEAYISFEPDWLGDIPKNWEIGRLKINAKIYNGDSLAPALKDKFTSENIEYRPYIASKDINVSTSSIEYENGIRIPKEYKSYREAPSNSSLICIEGGSAGRKIAFTDQKVCFVNKLACIHSSKILNKFLFYSLKAEAFQTQFNLSLSGLIGGVAISAIGNFSIVIPPIEIQQQIVKFLDKKTVQIDDAIAIKEQQISLLKERKQIIIQKAVTEGLNPDTPMKDSGVDWIGQIPAHWSVIRLKYLFEELNDRTDTGQETLLSLRMEMGLVPHDDVSEKPIFDAELVGYKRVVPGQMVMNRMRAAIGIFGIPRQSGLVSPDYAVFDAIRDMKIDFFLLLFKTPLLGTQFRLGSKGLGTGSSGFMRLYSENFGDIKVPLCSKSEQSEIMDFINTESIKIDDSINLIAEQIEKLKEYKTTLINSAVTGKIKVA